MLIPVIKNNINQDEPDAPFPQVHEPVNPPSVLTATFIREFSNNLDSFIADQKKDIAHTDSSFLTLGQNIQRLYSKTTELTDKIHHSAEILGGNEENGVLSQLGQSITGALTELETRQNEVNSSLQQVAIVGKGMKDFHAMCPTLEAIAKFLRIIGLNICVECAQSPEASSIFMAHAEEIKDFAEKVIRINKDIRYGSQHSRDVLTASHKKISGSLSRIQNLSNSAAIVVEDAFLKIQQLMNLSLAAMDQATRHSGKISGQVSEIVMGIQFHDNMSQRIEHIHTALQEASQHCNAEDPNTTNVEKMAEVHAITVIQAGQIREIIAGLENVFQGNRQAFSEIGNEVEGLAEILVSLVSSNDTQHDDSFTTLQSALLELSQLLEYGNEQMGMIQEANAEASGTADRLEKHIGLLRTISDDTHIKALNTIILANHLGPAGRTIEILAKEIKDIANQSNAFVVDVEKVYQVLFQAITSLQTPDQEETDPVVSYSSLLHTNIQETTTAYHTFIDDSSAALQYAENLGTEITEISENLTFLPALAATLEENLSKLDNLIQQLSPWAGQMSEEAKAKAARLAERYTMDEERLIHQQAFSETGESSNEDIELFGEDSDDTDIEMFDQEPESGELELFDQDLTENNEEVTEIHQAKKPTQEKDLGDNFELF